MRQVEAVLSVLVLHAFLPIASSQQCPCGASHNAQFKKCYDYEPIAKSFLDAQQNCQNEEGQLVSIQNAF